MKVIIDPGCYHEQVKNLADAVAIETFNIDPRVSSQVFDYAEKVSRQNAALIDMLAEKGILTLDDCIFLGAPDMVFAR